MRLLFERLGKSIIVHVGGREGPNFEDEKKLLFLCLFLLAMMMIPTLVLGLVEQFTMGLIREDIRHMLLILEVRGSIESADKLIRIVTELMQQMPFIPVRFIAFLGQIPIPWWVINSFIGLMPVLFLSKLSSVNQINRKLWEFEVEMKPFLLSLASASLAISLFYTNLVLRDREALYLAFLNSNQQLQTQDLSSSIFLYSFDRFFQLLMLTTFVLTISLASVGASLRISSKTTSSLVCYVRSTVAIADLAVATTLVVFLILNLPYVPQRT